MRWVLVVRAREAAVTTLPGRGGVSDVHPDVASTATEEAHRSEEAIPASLDS